MRGNSQFVDMEDDIVTRIEEHLHGNMKNTSEFLLALAADEIERLRLLATRLVEEGRCRHCTDFPGIWHNNCAWHALEQDVRGE